MRLDIYHVDFGSMYIQTLHWSADCLFEVQRGLSRKTSSEINSTKSSDANRVPSTARSLKNVERQIPSVDPGYQSQ